MKHRDHISCWCASGGSRTTTCLCRGSIATTRRGELQHRHLASVVIISRTFRTIFLKVDDKAMGAASKHWQMALEIFQALAAGEG